ncbi:MAG: YncE family protein, partial [Sandaracinaceae bacterium]
MRWLVSLVCLGAACTPPTPLRPSAGPVRIERASARPSRHPPIRGGSLLVTRDGRRALVADGGRDVIWIVDVATGLTVRDALELEPGDEPWRMTEGDSGRAYVVLRGAGALATIDIATSALVDRRQVCTEPRGVTWDSTARRALVACAGGEVISASEGATEKLVSLAPDLRDIWIAGGRLSVSRFRSATSVDVSIGTGARPPTAQLPVAPTISTQSATYEPTVAYRTVGDGRGGAWMLHQRQRETPFISERPFLYYGGSTNGSII